MLNVLDVGMSPLGRTQIAAFRVRVDRAHQVEVLRHRLTPFLGELHGGSTCCIGAQVDPDLMDQPINPDRNCRKAELDRCGAPTRAGALHEVSKDNAATDIANFLCLHLHVLDRAEPFFEEAPNRRAPLKPLSWQIGVSRVPHRVGRVEAKQRIKVACISGINSALRELHQVGGRGLLGHRAAKYRGRLPSGQSERPADGRADE